ncbi:MAG TPA: OmpA family protein [Candidatus Eisenbacteria bacterium]|nr:OmpA family protein [Candidatus Eisenbacteria bacterium]
MRTTFHRSLLVLSTLLLALPATARADDPAFWIVPGGGLYWPPAEFGVEDPVPSFGGILGLRLGEPVALELRGHYTKADSEAVYAASSDLTLLHGEGNVTWFLTPRSPVTPYVTLGAGVMRADVGEETDSRFAWNAGAGLRARLTDNLSIRVDGRNVSYEVGAPNSDEEKMRYSLEAFGGLSFGFGGSPSDEDLDGVKNDLDRCPATPAGARVDASGCPLDADQDGVYDGLDQCESTPRGSTVDAAGCPYDRDLDGVPDGPDACPDTPTGATVNATGCPADADGDGVYDGLDQCDATPRGCTVNPNGCPTDADQDGVCDGVDTCPDTPSDVRVDAKGCPLQVSVRETELMETGMIRLQDVNFDTGKATIKSESFRVLDDVGGILSRWPQLRIEIGGHTDARGSDALNQKLSDSRAKAVRDYLLNKFPELDPGQFTAVGYGERQPIASNTTALGMAKNRRVEFKVLNKEALRKENTKQQFIPKE